MSPAALVNASFAMFFCIASRRSLSLTSLMAAASSFSGASASFTSIAAEGFAEALSKVDKLILLDIYPAREEPIPGVTSEIIYDKVTAPEKVLLKKEELMGYLEKEPVDVLVTFGAGNIDRFIEPIEDMLKKRVGE
mgnify:CR=1 FL=1